MRDAGGGECRNAVREAERGEECMRGGARNRVRAIRFRS